MATRFNMPKASEQMEEGVIVTWKKKAGEAIKKGAHLLDIESEKAIVAIESPINGVLLEILVNEGETVPVGTPIAVLEEAGSAH